MPVARLVGSYVLWHYTRAYGDLRRLMYNGLWFLWHFFSFRILFATFFAPFERVHESYGNAVIEPGQFAAALAVNTLMRGIGIVMRTLLMAVGVVTMAAYALVLALVILLWAFLPVAVFFLLLSSIGLIASSV